MQPRLLACPRPNHPTSEPVGSSSERRLLRPGRPGLSTQNPPTPADVMACHETAPFNPLTGSCGCRHAERSSQGVDLRRLRREGPPHSSSCTHRPGHRISMTSPLRLRPRTLRLPWAPHSGRQPRPADRRSGGREQRVITGEQAAAIPWRSLIGGRRRRPLRGL